MFKHILVPTDGTQFSLDTVRRAVSFAKEAGAQVTLLNVKRHAEELHWGKGMWVHLPSPETIEEFAEQEAQVVLAEAEKLCMEADVECSKVSRTYDAIYEGIIEVAKECGCDLIFMASHGRRGLNALVLGSETHKVLTHSHIPVLVYR